MNTSNTKPGFRLGPWYHVVNKAATPCNGSIQRKQAAIHLNATHQHQQNISGPPSFPAPQFPSPIPTTVGLPYPRLA